MPLFLMRLLTRLGLMWAFAYADGDDGGGTDSDEGGDDDLGESGKKALDAERDARKAADKARKAADKELADLKARLAEIEESNKSDAEKAVEKAREEAKAEARKEAAASANTRLVRAEIKAAAAGKVSDLDIAMAYLERNLDAEDFVDSDGDIDSAAVEKAVAKLIKDKPALAVDTKGTPKPGSGDGGARGGGDQPEPTPGIGRIASAYANSK